MEIVIGLVILYVIQAVLIYGMTYGYFESQYPGAGHRGIAAILAILAGILPILGPLQIFFLSDWAEHGLRYK